MTAVWLKRYALIKRTITNCYQLEAICTTCKSRGNLWFIKDFIIKAHLCPKCHRPTLESPVWLNIHRKKNSLTNNKNF